MRDFDDLRRALAALGHVEGRNLSIHWAFVAADSSDYSAAARELAAQEPDVIFTSTTPRTLALQAATRRIPIVTAVSDPVASGFAQSLARPGGNITGLAADFAAMQRKTFELLLSMIPTIRRLVLFYSEKVGSQQRASIEKGNPVAREFGLESSTVFVADASDLERRIRSLAGLPHEAASVFPNDLEPARIARAAIERRVPTFAPEASWVAAGGLMSFFLYHQDPTARLAGLIDKVLRGQKPADIPFELPTRTHFTVNRSTAAALRIVIPPALLARADRVY